MSMVHHAILQVQIKVLTCFIGPITHLSLAGDHIIVLSDPADAEELVRSHSLFWSSMTKRAVCLAWKSVS